MNHEIDHFGHFWYVQGGSFFEKNIKKRKFEGFTSSMALWVPFSAQKTDGSKKTTIERIFERL